GRPVLSAAPRPGRPPRHRSPGRRARAPGASAPAHRQRRSRRPPEHRLIQEAATGPAASRSRRGPGGRISAEDLAPVEDLVPPGVPDPPCNPDPPPYFEGGRLGQPAEHSVGDADAQAAEALALALDLDDLDPADLAGGRDMGPAVRLLVQAHDVDDP